MIAEIIPGSCDIEGRPILRPDNRRRGFQSTFPIGRYFSRELSTHCSSLKDLARFLRCCRKVSDEEQFGKDEYWQPPDEFEKSRKGDCDDFALWAWRQLVEMGYEARLVVGKHGRYGAGHAWVMVKEEGRWFFLEPQRAYLGLSMPRFSTLTYHPEFSVRYDNGKANWFAHKQDVTSLGASVLLQYFLPWLWFWSKFWVKHGWKVPYVLPKYWYGRMRKRTKTA